MQKVFKAGEELFFDILLICLVSFIYFEFIPMNDIVLVIGVIFSILYFGVNIYIGYKYKLNISDSLMVGVIGCGVGLFLSLFSLYSQIILNVIGCGVGLFLSLFSLYSQIILNSPNMALWIIKPYFIPTMSLIKLFINNISLSYVFILMLINILLVPIGSISKKFMNKLSRKI